MRITRRQFLKASSASAAVIASPHALIRAFGARRAHAMGGPADPILVVIQWDGGNDGLNTVIPLDGPQRAAYAAFRPQIGFSPEDLMNTLLNDTDPNGTELAFHPQMTALRDLYDQGKVALINAVGYPEVSGSMSHFTSEVVWFSADPYGPRERGWVGSVLDQGDTSQLRAVSFARNTSKIFDAFQATALGLREVDDFQLPDDPISRYRDLPARILAWDNIYPVELLNRHADDQTLSVARTAGGVIDINAQLLEIATNWMDWPSNLLTLSNENNKLAEDLFQAASVIRHDVLSLEDTGLRFFHVRLPGFDTHSSQERIRSDLLTDHGRLLKWSSDAIRALYDDLYVIDSSGALADRTLIMTFSEFGRRPTDNREDEHAGTDHGTASPLFLIGNAVNDFNSSNTRMYGSVPDLNDLIPEFGPGGQENDQAGNLLFEFDFREVYATIIQNWLGVDPSLVIPSTEVWSPIPGVLPPVTL